MSIQPYNSPIDSYYDSRILVVDDASLNRELIVTYLQHAGFKNLETAIDGIDALKKVEEFQPDMLVLDLVMPNLDGVGVIRNLRQNPGTKHIPIIVQTTVARPEERVDAWESGATDVITKPIHRLELLSRIKVQLEHSILLRQLEKYHRLAAEDIHHALKVQMSLLPTHELMKNLEERHHITIDSMFVPSRFLSGDVWGIVDLGSDQLGIWICDFSGKGIRAALHTFRLHTLIQEFRHCADDPTEIVDALNSRLVKVMPEGQFSTFLMGVVDFKKDLFTYAAASSTHPLIYFPKENRFEVGDGTGVPLGVIDQQSYPLKTMPFPKGSSLVLYSDMLWESEAIPDISFQPEDLKELGIRVGGASLVKAVKEKLSPLKDYHFVDDLTLIEIHRTEEGDLV